MNIRKSIQVFIFLFISAHLCACVSASNSSLPDFMPGMLCGTTFRDDINQNQNQIAGTSQADRAAYLKARKTPLVFMNSLPNAKSVKVVTFTTRDAYVISVFTGALAGFEGGDLPGNVIDEMKGIAITIAENEVLVINNIQIDVETSGIREFWNNYLGSFILRVDSYNVAAEVAKISTVDLLAYIDGTWDKDKKDIKPEDAEKPLLFKGIVHSISGKNLTISSARTTGARPGATIVLLDRTGKKIGTAKVINAFHTNISATVTNGAPQQGFTAVIYGQ